MGLTGHGRVAGRKVTALCIRRGPYAQRTTSHWRLRSPPHHGMPYSRGRVSTGPVAQRGRSRRQPTRARRLRSTRATLGLGNDDPSAPRTTARPSRGHRPRFRSGPPGRPPVCRARVRSSCRSCGRDAPSVNRVQRERSPTSRRPTGRAKRDGHDPRVSRVQNPPGACARAHGCHAQPHGVRDGRGQRHHADHGRGRLCEIRREKREDAPESERSVACVRRGLVTGTPLLVTSDDPPAITAISKSSMSRPASNPSRGHDSAPWFAR